MLDLHIDDFYKDAGLILLALFMTFPRKSTVYVEDICGPDEVDEYGLHSARFLSCFGTMIWMGEEGYLRYEDTIRQEAIDQAVLSHKAFMLLSARHEFISDDNNSEADELPPSVLAQRQTNVFCLNEAIRQGSSEKIRQIMHYLLARHS